MLILSQFALSLSVEQAPRLLFDQGFENLGLRLAEGDLHCLFDPG